MTRRAGKRIINKFGLFFPTGEQYFHKKDIPTGMENFCYTAGDRERTFVTPLDVPFIHASHASSFQGGTLRDINRKCTRKIHGDAMILDSAGNALCRVDKKAGIWYAEVEPFLGKKDVCLPEDKYWVLKLPGLLEKGFYLLNEKFAQYYEQISKSEIAKRIKSK